MRKLMAKMLAYQPLFSARTQEEEEANSISPSDIEDVMYAYLREDEAERHQKIIEETEQYYRELIAENV